jgi:hypothetical protein
MTTIQGQFRHLIYSPRGSIEGILMTTDQKVVQIVFDKHDETAPLAFEQVKEGEALVIEGRHAKPSLKGEAEHPVYDYVRLVSVSGTKPIKRKAAAGAAYQGVVVRFNYARHGAANGVVLDTGDFIHVKPEGMAKLALKVGDRCEADGDAQLLVGGHGWAVEAIKVNRKNLVPR